MIRRALFLLLIATTLHAAPYRFAGRPLSEALRELQSRGLRIIYSDDVVTSEMIVRAEPRATLPRKILDELLREHALRADDGPRGSLLIVREERPQRESAPPTSTASAGCRSTLEEIVVTPSRFTILRQEAGEPAVPQPRRSAARAASLRRSLSRHRPDPGNDERGRQRALQPARRRRGRGAGARRRRGDLRSVSRPRSLSRLQHHRRRGGGIGGRAERRIPGGVRRAHERRGGHQHALAGGDANTKLGVSLLNTRLLSQGTFAQSRGAWLFSLRRGYLREVLTLIDDAGDIDPRYYDLLGKVQWTLGRAHRRLGARDGLARPPHAARRSRHRRTAPRTTTATPG